MKLLKLFLLVGISTSLSYAQTNKTKDSKTLSESFVSPPNEAKPRVWWHWMNGNVTKHGIQKDLEWMDRTGIGGFQNFDANLMTPVVVEKKLEFMTEDWKDAFKFTTDLAKEKGLEMAIAGSPGWSVTGGPWVEPKDGMKKFVWTETYINGGKQIKVQLNQPNGTASSFQDYPLEQASALGGYQGTIPQFYKDAYVIAYRLNEKEQFLSELKPIVTSSGGEFNLEALTDQSLSNPSFLPPVKVGEDMYIQYEFKSAQTFKSMTLAGAVHDVMGEFNGNPENRYLSYSNDGVNFTEIARIGGSTVPLNTVNFPETTAKYWRINFTTLAPNMNSMLAIFGGGEMFKKESDGVNVSEFNLFTTDRVDQVEDKAGFSPWKESADTRLVDNADIIGEVIDISDKMDADGNLLWKAPKGKWAILRFGYSITGRQNHPASPEATGLEVDKLNKEAVRKYINHYLDLYKDATGNQMGESGLSHMILDSYEAGHMNWTKDFSNEFKARRGYDIAPWLPVLVGKFVKSGNASEKFLWDFRKTIGEMIAENHYDVIGEELHKRGMKRYTESHENMRIYLADGMDVKRNADIPMSAMWTPGGFGGDGVNEEVRSEGDIRESASVANIYGKPFVAAESMTSIMRFFSFHPEVLKRTADLELASGLNRYVIHCSVHQPLDDKMPGFSLGPFGQYFGRQETWAEDAHAWISYLARGSYLLQQGKNVADFLYLYGENDNITLLTVDHLPSIPEGFEFDFVNATILKEAIEAKDGKLVSTGGASYEYLMLDKGTQKMTLSTLKKIKELADQGIKIIGKKPVDSPSLSDDSNEFKKLASEIWSKENVGEDLSVSLKSDVQVTETNHKVLFKHRTDGARDIYWLNNRNVEPTTAKIGFRVTGKKPMKWNPMNAEISEVSYTIKDGITWVNSDFESWDAYFIVFEDKTELTTYEVPETAYSELLTINAPWNVKFQEKRGAPESIVMNELTPWNENKIEGIKHFSGSAYYSNSFNLKKLDKKAQYLLNLGEVHDLAEVFVNGQNLGVIWKAPFKMNITRALKKGQNDIQIKVTNTWVNRLVGDNGKAQEDKITYTTLPMFSGQEPLEKSGLLGNVSILKSN